MTNDLKKYPRTTHIQGSRKSGDDFELEDVPFEIALLHMLSGLQVPNITECVELFYG